MYAMESDELMHHLFVDLLWKIGIVALTVVVVLVLMVVIYRVVNRRQDTRK